MKKYVAISLACMALTGCMSSGPQKPLDEMAKALTERDAPAFLAHMDMKRFTAHQVQDMTQGNIALETLDNVGKKLGLGGISEFLGVVMDSQKKATEDFTRGVSTGELINLCTRSQKPHCPWVPESLQAAKVKELSENTAVAQITTPAGMTSWLALAKIGENWKVVGQAVLEKDATLAAQGLAVEQGAPSSTKEKAPQQPSSSSDPYAPAPPPPAASESPKSSEPPKSSGPSAPDKEDPYAPAPPPPVTKL